MNKSSAIDAIHDFKKNQHFPRTIGNPVFLNTARLVEMDPDTQVMELWVYNGDDIVSHLFIEHEAIVGLLDNPNKISFTIQVDDKAGGFISRRVLYRNRGEAGVIVDAQEKEHNGKWKQLAGTDKGGVFLTHKEWEKVAEYSRLWHAYGQTCANE